MSDKDQKPVVPPPPDRESDQSTDHVPFRKGEEKKDPPPNPYHVKPLDKSHREDDKG